MNSKRPHFFFFLGRFEEDDEPIMRATNAVPVPPTVESSRSRALLHPVDTLASFIWQSCVGYPS